MGGARGPDLAGTIRVVGVALLSDHGQVPRVLAARRADEAHLGRGRWELPGGKCGPGELLADAAVREVEEELGCRVAVTGALDGRQPIRPGLTLEVVTAYVVDGEPVPLEHDALRWLGPDELGEVTWLAPDVPFLGQLAELLRQQGRTG